MRHTSYGGVYVPGPNDKVSGGNQARWCLGSPRMVVWQLWMPRLRPGPRRVEAVIEVRSIKSHFRF